MHTPPSTFEIRNSEYPIHSSAPSYRRPQTHPFGEIALRNQSVISGYPYPLPVLLVLSPRVVKRRSPLAVPGVDSKSSIVDATSIHGPSLGPIKASTSTRRRFLPALPTMAWDRDAEVPLNIEPVQPPPTTVNAPTSALIPRTPRSSSPAAVPHRPRLE